MSIKIKCRLYLFIKKLSNNSFEVTASNKINGWDEINKSTRVRWLGFLNRLWEQKEALDEKYPYLESIL